MSAAPPTSIPPDASLGEFSGFFPGKVVDTNDPEKAGRVRVRVNHTFGNPAKNDGEIQDDQLPWAFPAFQVTGVKSGEYHVPPVGSQVWVGWYGGVAEYPIWMGGTTPTADIPDEFTSSYEDGAPKTRFVKTDGESIFEMRWKTGEKKIRLEMPNGVKLEMLQDEAPGGPKITVETPLGYRMELDELGKRAIFQTPTQKVEMLETAPGALTIQTPGAVTVDGALSALVKSAGPTTVEAGALLTLATAGGLTLGAPGGGQGGGATNVDMGGLLNMNFAGVAALTFGAGLSIAATAVLALSGLTISLLLTASLAAGLTLGAAGTFYKLIDQRFLAIYDAHVHPIITAPGTSGPPTVLATPLLNSISTSNTVAN